MGNHSLDGYDNRDLRAEATSTGLAPQPKVAAGGIAGAVALVLVWVAGLAGLDVPAEVAAAVVMVLSFAASYLKRG